MSPKLTFYRRIINQHTNYICPTLNDAISLVTLKRFAIYAVRPHLRRVHVGFASVHPDDKTILPPPAI